MGHKFAEIAFTPTVKTLQEQLGSRANYARMESAEADRNHIVGPSEAGFIAQRDSFYMASVSETGWPYVQHRGGPEGFVRVLNETTIGFSDFAGNRQYVSVGNLMHDDRVSLFFMDYPNRTRLKLLGHVKLVDPSDSVTLTKLAVPGYRARIDRGFLISVEAFDWNCAQHITPRFSLEQVEASTAPLRERIANLEAELARAPQRESRT
jgi:uncharacterized protein